ncbi:MAG: DNA repair protein [Bacteroidetes bacterium HGW-Bacteroidetes-20]|nr:MAG: DNA repair protein [Bacteroidetes bacterium HGW-Bacteroidetes-20]
METTKKTKEFTVNEVTTTYKPAFKSSERPKILNPNDLYELILKYEPMQEILNYKEMFVAVYVNQNSTVLSIQRIGEGGLTATSVDIRIIMQSALLQCATGIFLLHNHPSRHLRPSQADINLTKKVKQAAEFFDIKILDHLIISDESYYSMFEHDQF